MRLRPGPWSPSTHRLVGVGLAVLSGITVAVQTRMNGELGVRLGDGIAAATVSFALGLLILLVTVPALPSGRRGLRRLRQVLTDGSLRPWQCLGGMCGALLVATQGLTVATLGVAVFTVSVVAGQTASSLAVDRAGIGPTGRQPATANRIAGAVLTVPAVFIAVSDRIGDPSTLLLAGLPLLAGIAIAWQQAVNGQVRMASDSTLAATVVNFTAGTAVLLAALAADLTVRGWPAGHLPTEPWFYLGGPIGIGFIAIAAAVVRFTGVLLLGLATVAGQLVGAVLLDATLPAATSQLGGNTLLGAGLALLAVLIAAVRPPGG